MIEYLYSVEEITPDQLHGFFVGWPNPPTPETHLRLLRNSNVVILALDRGTGKVAGFITAIADGVLSAYIPLLEVLPAYQRQQIGRTLALSMLERLQDFYMIDLLCEWRFVTMDIKLEPRLQSCLHQIWRIKIEQVKMALA
jgi:ribosomal protein S18 acetylase RimI-like enzyme